MSDGYIIGKCIAKTDHSELYEAYKKNGEETDLLRYIAKKYMNISNARDLIKHEKDTTQIIENECKGAVVIPILDVEEKEDGIYEIMQLKRNGVFLSEIKGRLIDGSIEIKDKLTIVVELLNALKLLHEAGWIHLDIHPGNTFLENAGLDRVEGCKVKLIDFSNAVRRNIDIEDEHSFNLSSYTIGFSAPEIIYGQNECVDITSDLFSASAVMNWIFFQKPFIDAYGCLSDVKLKQELCGISMKVFCSMYCAMLKKGTAYESRYRYQTEMEFLEDLRELASCEEAYRVCCYDKVISMAYKLDIPLNESLSGEMSFNSREFLRAIKDLYLSTKKDRVDYSFCYYYFKRLWEYQDVVINHTEISKSDISLLISSGITACNMAGDTLTGTYIYDIFQNYKGYIPIDEYMAIQLRSAAMVADTYDFRGALNIVSESVDGLELIRNAKKEAAKRLDIENEDSYRSPDLARSYSAKACYMVLCGSSDHKKIMDLFEKSIIEFGNQYNNRAITVSHMLHYAIDLVASDINRDEGYRIFEKYDREYLVNQCKNTKQCWSSLNHNKDTLLYQYYVFFKSLYYLYLDNVDKALLRDFIDFLDDDRIRNASEHPIEMIYKYIGLIIYSCMESGIIGYDTRLIDQVFMKALTSNRYGRINTDTALTMQMLISYQTFYIYNSITGQSDQNKQLEEMLIEHSGNSKWSILTERLKNKCDIARLLTFEYS